MTKYHFGTIDNIHEGATFSSFQELYNAGLHGHNEWGISGNKDAGANSIVITGKYEDDEIIGDKIIYTGQGGRDKRTKQQIKNQTLNRGNEALITSFQYELPVRVSRKIGDNLYKFLGLFKVSNYRYERGISGFKVYKFELIKIPKNEVYKELKDENNKEYLATQRKSSNSLRNIRNIQIVKDLKDLYNFKCQICGIALELQENKFYAEGAHIKPLGNPHNGPDDMDNMLCLCPNHHKLFDAGALMIDNDFTWNLLGKPGGKITVKKGHNINREFLKYHRENIGFL